jgi:hypothetical protein
MRRTVAAMCVDTPAGPYGMKGTEYTFYMNPHVARSYTDALILEVAKTWLSEVKRPWHAAEFMTGTDTWLADPTVGIPTVWPYSGTGVHSHHNSEDRPETVDARSLRDIAVINAAFLYFVASAGQTEAVWLAQLAAERGLEQIRAAEKKGAEQVAYAVDRETSAVLSTLRLVDTNRHAAVRDQLSPLLKKLAALAPPSQPAATGSLPHLVVKRKRIGTIPLDDVPIDRREGFPSGAWASAPIIALYWCDGTRDLSEVARLTRLELGPVKLDFAGYFGFLARMGYVEVK